MIISAFNGVLTLVILIGVGFFLGKKGWFNENADNLMSKLVINISLPAFMIANLNSSFTREQFIGSLGGYIVAFLCITLTYLVGSIIYKAFCLSINRKGVFRALFGLSNTIFVGLPVNISIFGEQALPYILIYYIINTLFFWSIAAYDIRQDGRNINNKFFSKENLRNIISAPLVAFIFSAILILLQIKLPIFILDSCKYLGNLTTPLSTIFIGSILSSMNYSEMKVDKDSIFILIGRFIISPVAAFVLLSFTSFPLLMKQVFIVMSAMPVMNTVAIVAREYDGDYKFASILNATSLIASFVFIPIYVFLFRYIL
ncbi:AEC family transporter [Clostridium sp. YIM B02505]|uniref:AEC family transporter n=1 Tax=Clostridium yunnanense TaxID=2800325 RepID=A0ABS1EVL1_9CLOT|nr:AEC family transporter [Clostridium yunnanense]MBK1813426.1 AEC family transporter [Clostridium yunnanense]